MAPSLVSPVLVGRQAELESLAGGLERVLSGEQVTVLVGGEAGVGKSRLVHELIDRARDASVRVLVGGCVELAGGGMLDDEVLARAYGLVFPFSIGGIVAGSLVAAPLVSLLGLTGAMVTAGAGVLAVGALLLSRPLDVTVGAAVAAVPASV